MCGELIIVMQGGYTTIHLLKPSLWKKHLFFNARFGKQKMPMREHTLEPLQKVGNARPVARECV